MLISVHHHWTFPVPILKYTLLVGCSLLALLFVAERTLAPTTATASNTSSSFEILKKMANHGGSRGFAPLADAGVFLPMPAPTLLTETAAVPDAPVIAAAMPVSAPQSISPSVLDAHARFTEAEVIDKPIKRARKIANRKPKPSRNMYVENVSRAPTGFFGALQSW